MHTKHTLYTHHQDTPKRSSGAPEKNPVSTVDIVFCLDSIYMPKYQFKL